MSMNKQEVINEVAKRAKITKRDAKESVTAVFDTLLDELSQGSSVSIAGFGTFNVSKRNERNGRNPQTGEVLTIPEHTVPTFKAHKALRNAVK